MEIWILFTNDIAETKIRTQICMYVQWKIIYRKNILKLNKKKGNYKLFVYSISFYDDFL